MKKNIFIPLLAAVGMIALLPSCENNYEDATSIHVYGENDTPPLKGSDADNASHSMSIQMNNTEWHSLDMKQFAPQLEAQLGETMDEVWAGLDSGKYRFLIVNPARRVWDKTAANAGDDTWALSASGIPTSSDQAVMNLHFDKANRELSYQLTDKALPGTIIPATVGIVRTDVSSYPVNFRIANKVTVADLSVVSCTVVVPDGDYAAETIEMGDYLANFEFTFGISDIKTIADGMDPNGKHLFDLYMLNDSGRYGNPPDGYTANNGYWLNAQQEVCAWGADGFSYFIEQWWGEEDGVMGAQIAFGRAPGLAPQEVDFSIVLVSVKDSNRAMTFLVHVIYQ